MVMRASRASPIEPDVDVTAGKTPTGRRLRPAVWPRNARREVLIAWGVVMESSTLLIANLPQVSGPPRAPTPSLPFRPEEYAGSEKERQREKSTGRK